MIPIKDKVVRIKNTAMTGIVTEVGCDKCIVLIGTRYYEYEFSELAEPISISIKNWIRNAFEWIIDTNYRFFEDKSGNGNVKVAVGVIVGTLLTLLLVWITNQ